MSEERRFTRLRRGSEPEGPGFYVVPDGGMCLSVFLVIQPTGGDPRVLLGRIDPEAPWHHLGAIERSRLATIGDRWLLPASQLLFFESPEEAALRIVREHLESDPFPLVGPSVFSEAYRRPESRPADPHWDLHFIFRGRWPSDRPPRASPWKELAFLDPVTLDAVEIGRGHADILDLVGLPPRRATAAPGPTTRPA
ncbi:MAG: hypothetical protein ABSB97_02815 [Thermoplasmata archaeon]|jgi:hypothetical protein